MVVCLPGAKIEAITERVKNIVGSGKGGSVLVHVGTNNVEREGTTAIVRKYRQLVRTLKQTRVEQVILSGIVPVMGRRGHKYRNCRGMAINMLVQKLCREEEVGICDCLTDILFWMESSKLKLNPYKTDLIIIGTKQQRNRVINHFPVKLLGSDTFPSDTVRILGVIFDSDFNFRQHISQVCKSCFYHICDLRRIRRHISMC